MKNNQKHIDDFFREKFGGYSENPPTDAWQEMDAKLDTLVPHVVPSSPFRWLGHVGMVSLIAVLGVSLIQKYAGKTETENGIVKEQTIEKIEATSSSVTTNNSLAGAQEVGAPEMDEDDNENNGQASKATALTNEGTHGTNPGKAGAGVGRKKAGHGGGNALASKEVSLKNKVAGEEAINDFFASSSVKAGKQTEPENQTDNQANAYNSSKAPTKATNPALAAENTLKTPVKPLVKHAPKPVFSKWEAGVKGGYERGFNNMAAKKYVIAPYIQYNLCDKLGVMIQPAVKYANSPERTIGTPKSYYKKNADGQVNDNGSNIDIKVAGTTQYYTYNGRYRYTQSHDSIVKTNKAGGTYIEFEMPVLIKYALSEKLSAYGGVNTAYSKMSGVTEHTYTKEGISRTVDKHIASETSMPAAPSIDEVITYDGTPFSEYNGPLYPAAQVSRIRLGAMLGISYEYSDRWLLDALIQQTPAPKDIRGGYDINTPLSSTYFRLSVGYKLTK